MGLARAVAGLCALNAFVGVVIRNIAATLAEGSDGLAAELVNQTDYFTIWCTVFVALVAAAMALRPGSWLAGARARLAALTAALITGLIFAVLLRYQLAESDPLQRVSSHMMHDITPPLFLLAWLLASHGGLGWRSWGWVAILPLTYLGTVLLRGLAPYWFLDLSTLGVLVYVRNVLGITAAFIAMALVLIAIDKGLARLARRGGSG